MTVIIPTVEGYDVCDYTPKLHGASFTSMSKDAINESLSNRKFALVKSFDKLEDARKFMIGTEYIIQYKFKEVSEDVIND
jgi:hypothetical protein